jgi:TRAP-type C4-dicarboxylate transport system permease small subunit
MKEPGEDEDIEAAHGVQRWLFYVGAAGLLFAIGADAVAVLGRHLGIPLLGSIELMQAAILLASSAAMVLATVARKHAVVHLVVDRLAPRQRMAMERVHALLSAIFFAALAAGSIWIAFDLRDGHEQSELLRIPYAPLRIVSIVAVLAVAAIYLARAFEKRAGP